MREFDDFTAALDRFTDEVSRVVKTFGIHMNQSACPCSGCRIRTASAVMHRHLAALALAIEPDSVVKAMAAMPTIVAPSPTGCERHVDCESADREARRLTGDSADHGPVVIR